MIKLLFLNYHWLPFFLTTLELGEEVHCMNEEKHWFAFHMFRNSRKQFLAKLVSDSQEYYVAEQVSQNYLPDYSVETVKKLLFPSIVFVRCTLEYVEKIRLNPSSLVAPYTNPGTKEPAQISDKEMQTFMFVLRTGSEYIEAVDEKMVKGDKVRVLDGLFKGAEGYIVRIKGDRRFVVTLEGVAAVATTYIPQRFLEKID